MKFKINKKMFKTPIQQTPKIKIYNYLNPIKSANKPAHILDGKVNVKINETLFRPRQLAS